MRLITLFLISTTLATQMNTVLFLVTLSHLWTVGVILQKQKSGSSSWVVNDFVSVRGSFLFNRSQSVFMRAGAILQVFQLVTKLFLRCKQLLDIIADKVQLSLQVYPASHDEPGQC